jgi:hypothetical protein
MKAVGLFLFVVLACAPATPAEAQRYTAIREGDTSGSATAPAGLSSVGDIAFEMQVMGHDVLRFPHTSLSDFKARPNATGVPFMGPWATRLDEQVRR